MNRDLNIKSTIRQILGVLISIMILMPFTVSSQTVTTTIDCANATTSRYKETITSKEQAGPSSSISVPQSKTQAEP